MPQNTPTSSGSKMSSSTSLISVRGKPLLPVLLSNESKQEMHEYKMMAIRVEARVRLSKLSLAINKMDDDGEIGSNQVGSNDEEESTQYEPAEKLPPSGKSYYKRESPRSRAQPVHEVRKVVPIAVNPGRSSSYTLAEPSEALKSMQAKGLIPDAFDMTSTPKQRLLDMCSPGTSEEADVLRENESFDSGTYSSYFEDPEIVTWRLISLYESLSSGTVTLEDPPLPPDATHPLLRGCHHLKKTSKWHPPSYNIMSPPRAWDPEMAHKFDKISAIVKGYLTRRLMRTYHVQNIIRTIRDSLICLLELQRDVDMASYSSRDRDLRRRLRQQIAGGLASIHYVFFELSTPQRMVLISSDRHRNRLRQQKFAALQDIERPSTAIPKKSSPVSPKSPLYRRPATTTNCSPKQTPKSGRMTGIDTFGSRMGSPRNSARKSLILIPKENAAYAARRKVAARVVQQLQNRDVGEVIVPLKRSHSPKPWR